MKTMLGCLAALVIGIAGEIWGVDARAADASCIVAQPESLHAANNPRRERTRWRIGLVAHDACKGELRAWIERNAGLLAEQELYSTGTTGLMVIEAIAAVLPGKEITLTRFNSGPLGGDQQMGALVSQKGLDILVFFVDPMSAHPHEADVRALLRLCSVHNIIVATTPSTADFVITSPYFSEGYAIKPPDYSSYVNRQFK